MNLFLNGCLASEARQAVGKNLVGKWVPPSNLMDWFSTLMRDDEQACSGVISLMFIKMDLRRPAAHFSTRSCFQNDRIFSPILMELWSTSVMVYLLNGLSHWFHCSIIEVDHIFFKFDDGDSCNHHETWLSINFNDLVRKPSLKLTKNNRKPIKEGGRTQPHSGAFNWGI